MERINDADLFKKMAMFHRKARMGGFPKTMGHEIRNGHRFPGPAGEMPRRHSAAAPEGYHGPTDGCFHPGNYDRRPPREAGGFPAPGGFVPPEGGMRRPALVRERILVILGKHPDGMRQKTVAEQMGINQSSASELVDKLENDGYIVRRIDPGDKRATLLFLTEKGEARAAEVEDERDEMIHDLFAVLTEEEKQTLSNLLDKLLSGSAE